ncbi:mobilization protein [Streptomyces sp. NPDC052042]|uniref:mobilization protein n=1 Tax=Streptomyces sp. NPDC052042 TaxID=3365683 RepID=UPI0037D2BF87
MIAKISSGKSTAGLIRYLYEPGRANEHTDPHLVASWDGYAPDPGRADDIATTRKQLVADLDLRVKQADRLGRAPKQHVWHWNDYLTADRELAAVETEYGLHQVARGDRTAAKRPTRAEQEKAHRNGQAKTARERLRAAVRTAVAAAASLEEFVLLLSNVDDMFVEVVYFPSGDVRGYKVARTDNTNADGEPVWFSGSELSPDLSFPKIRERLNDLDPRPIEQPGRRNPNPWHQATAAAERIPHHLDQDGDVAAQSHLAAFGEALDALPLVAPQDLRYQLRQATAAFERATRSHIHVEHHHTRALRSAVRTMLREPVPKDGTALAMFLDAAILVVTASARWHQLHHHDHQVAAAQQTLIHLQAAYDQVAAEPLAALALNRPPQQTVDRHIRHLRRAMPEHAEQIVQDAAFSTLAGALAKAESAGHDPEKLLRQAADQRALDDARSPARTLTWRIQRLSARQTPSARTHAAMARSSAQRSAASAHAAAVAPAPQPSRTRRHG